MWKCPNCKREFLKINQNHSCNIYSIEKHFENKKEAKELYNELLKILKSKLGDFKIESLPCCIHLVNTKTNYTYLCIYALKDSIKLTMALEKEPKNKNIKKAIQISNNNYKYAIIIKNKKEIDNELISYIKLANKK